MAASALAEGIMGEIRRHPYTSVTALLCLGLVIVGGPTIWAKKADAADVQALSKQIKDLSHSVRRDSTQGELSKIRSELFDISLRIRAAERTGADVDVILLQRREELLAQQRRLEASLQSMDAAQ
jgi:hypothetical protein